MNRTSIQKTNKKINFEHYQACYAMLSHFSRVRLCVTPQMAATRLPHPWDSQGKNTGVGCHFLLQCIKVKSQSEVAQLYPTLSDPMDCSLPGSSIHGIFQARVLEWGAIAFSDYQAYIPTNIHRVLYTTNRIHHLLRYIWNRPEQVTLNHKTNINIFKTEITPNMFFSYKGMKLVIKRKKNENFMNMWKLDNTHLKVRE